MQIDARGSEKLLSFCCLKIDNVFCVSRLTREGSGTTGHAILALNQEDCGNRTFTLVTNNENQIGLAVCYERLYRINNGVGTKKEIDFD